MNTIKSIIQFAGFLAIAPIALVACIIAIPVLPFLLGGREECIEDGIVPASRRYDFDFRAEVEQHEQHK